MKIVLTADWLVTYGGAEHVLAEFNALFPSAPFFTTVAKLKAMGPLSKADIRTTYLQRLYALIHNHQVLLPFMPRAMESIDLTGYDVVLSSSHAVGKGIIPPPSVFHVCYCHTPMRYAWEMEDEYLNDFGVPGILRPMVKRQLARLRRWDLTTAKRVDMFIANSTTTQERIKRIYKRESVVIAPPVDERFLREARDEKQEPLASDLSSLISRSYFLAVGRLVPYKRFDLLIEVANELQLPLKISGRGQDEARLKAMAGPTVEFLGHTADDALPGLYANAQALLFPQYEDAGIVLLEAQACGTPVIAFKAGGAMDAMADGTTGIFFGEQTVESVRSAVERFRGMSWDREAIRSHASKFSQDIFRKKMKAEIENAYSSFKDGTFKRK
jgi:glycosyltransferase involved in cell wall biosynthesis